MEPSAAPLDTTPDPAIVQPPGANPPGAPREQQQQQEQLRIGESGQFSEGLEDRGEHLSVRPSVCPPPSCTLPSAVASPSTSLRPEAPDTHPDGSSEPSPQHPLARCPGTLPMPPHQPCRPLPSSPGSRTPALAPRTPRSIPALPPLIPPLAAV